MSYNTNLITTQAFVQAPIIQVTIGKYTFGVKKSESNKIEFPNYVQSIEITKINGQVNTYTLNITYPIDASADPNFFEKVFSSVATTRDIIFTYGDSMNPTFLYRNEEALITKVKSSFQLESSCISYTVSAVSKANLGFSGCYNFKGGNMKPSDRIIEILKNPLYHLQELFTGMRNITQVEQANLIPHNDVAVELRQQENMSVLSYLEYLVSMMSTDLNMSNKSSIYILTYQDDTSGVFNGSYFKVVEVDTAIEHPEAFQLDIGYPGSNYVFNFQVENDESFAIYYNYQNSVQPNQYVSRINADGDYEEVYAPSISSKNERHKTDEKEKTWWSKVTQYPIKSSVTIKGLLRPAVLMNYVRLNIWLYGKKHINSGLYIITKQVDKVDGSGYQTTLNLLRISGDTGI